MVAEGYDESIQDTGSPESGFNSSNKYTEVDERSAGSLDAQYRTRIIFLHRTARNFVFEIKDGQAFQGELMDMRDIRFRNVMRAQLAAGSKDFGSFVEFPKLVALLVISIVVMRKT